MPDAIDAIRKAGVGPVDMQQSVIGPGMGVFKRYCKVLEDDDSTMGVKTAISLINRVWEEIENELDANFDPETQVALAWFRIASSVRSGHATSRQHQDRRQQLPVRTTPIPPM